MWENSTYTYKRTLCGMAQLNGLEQHMCIQCTHPAAQLDQMQENSKYTYIHTSHGMAQLKAKEQHRHTQNRLHSTTQANAGEQHVYIHTQVKPHGSIAHRRATHVYIYIHTSSAWHSLIECVRAACMHTYTHGTVQLEKMGGRHIYTHAHCMAWLH
jgi:hypothetical protein